MKCRFCDSEDLRVLESREGQYDVVRRRRECSNGHRFTTIEVHSDVASQAPHAKQFARRTTRRVTYARNIEIAQNLFRGGDVLAEKYGLKVVSIYAAARHGRASLILQRKARQEIAA